MQTNLGRISCLISLTCTWFWWLTFCCSSVAQLCPALCNPMDCSTPGFPVLHHLLELAQTYVRWVSDAVQLSHPLLSSSPPAFFPRIRVFSNESVLCIRWPKYWSFSFSISPPNKYSGLMSFRTDWFALLAVQGTLKRLLQHHSSKTTFLQCSAFFMVQFSHPYMTTRKTIALTIQTLLANWCLCEWSLIKPWWSGNQVLERKCASALCVKMSAPWCLSAFTL